MIIKKKLAVILVGTLVSVYACLSVYFIATRNIEELLLCTEKGGLNIPFSKSLCRSYFFSARGNQGDIDKLHQGIGASFVVQGDSPVSEREQVLKYLISKGLDPNRIDMDRLTPLHRAVIANSGDEVALLLRNGALVNQKDKHFELTPLELALKLQHDDKQPIDRQEIIVMLRNAK